MKNMGAKKIKGVTNQKKKVNLVNNNNIYLQEIE